MIDLKKNKAMREVVDGQQRIRSMLEFVEDKFKTRHPKSKKKVLYSGLTPAEKRIFRSTQLSGGMLLNATDPDVIEIFGRLNSVAKTLNGQEKRNSRFSGEFKQFCLEQASERVGLWRDLGVFSANDIARMNEVQFVADVALNMLKGLSDFSLKKLDDVYGEYEDNFGQEKNRYAFRTCSITYRCD